MINEIIRNLFRFLILVLLQALIIKNIELGQYINPFLYILFILILPFDTPNWLLLLSSFLLGISMDMFYDTPGMHAAACVFMGFSRPAVLKFFSPREGYDLNAQPTMQYLGAPWFFSYAGTLTLFHHFVLFYTEVFRFQEFFSTFFRVLLSTVFTLLLIAISQLLFYGKQK